MKNKLIINAFFGMGLAAVAWVAWGFVGASNALALTMTALVAITYVFGAWELQRYRQATATLAMALNDIPEPLLDLDAWLGRIQEGLRQPVRRRIEGERTALPGPALTPYLVGLLVMLGMLGTFLGMVVTFKGAVFALEGSSDLAAIRAALAEPIKGLGLSFGTSVAGVAASAILGLISALSRRDRLEAVRLLDARIGTVLRPFSHAQQREETFKALQLQAHALPLIADRLQAMMDSLAQRTDQLGTRLQDQQQRFHEEAARAYTELAAKVGRSLEDSLSASARLSGETIKPVIASAMDDIRAAARQTHVQLIDATQAQMQALNAQWTDAAHQAGSHWLQAAEQQSRSSEALLSGLAQHLRAFTQGFEEHARSLLSSMQDAARTAQSEQQSADEKRLASWQQGLSDMTDALSAQWQGASAAAQAQQLRTCEALEEATGQTLRSVAQLVNQSEALVRSRVESEAQWVSSQGERMDQLTTVWRSELAALRDQEARRGEAAIASLDALQATVARHLADLGASLEAPMSRLMQTASEVPQAAAEVITQLRQDMAQLSERDNLAVAERTAMMGQLDALLKEVNHSTQAQRAAIESLVHAAADVLAQAGQRFASALGDQAGKVDEVAARVAASAVELASLGEAFNHGVGLFSASNDKLLDGLARIESALSQSMSRSDEQLAYYVAQAREVIDLSISSQQGIVEDLRRLHHAQPAARLAGAA